MTDATLSARWDHEGHRWVAGDMAAGPAGIVIVRRPGLELAFDRSKRCRLQGLTVELPTGGGAPTGETARLVEGILGDPRLLGPPQGEAAVKVAELPTPDSPTLEALRRLAVASDLRPRASREALHDIDVLVWAAMLGFEDVVREVAPDALTALEILDAAELRFDGLPQALLLTRAAAILRYLDLPAPEAFSAPRPPRIDTEDAAAVLAALDFEPESEPALLGEPDDRYHELLDLSALGDGSLSSSIRIDTEPGGREPSRWPTSIDNRSTLDLRFRWMDPNEGTPLGDPQPLPARSRALLGAPLRSPGSERNPSDPAEPGNSSPVLALEPATAADLRGPLWLTRRAQWIGAEAARRDWRGRRSGAQWRSAEVAWRIAGQPEQAENAARCAQPSAAQAGGQDSEALSPPLGDAAVHTSEVHELVRRVTQGTLDDDALASAVPAFLVMGMQVEADLAAEQLRDRTARDDR